MSGFQVDFDDMYLLSPDPPRPESIPARRAWWRGFRARFLKIKRAHNPFRIGTVDGKSQGKFEFMWNEGWRACNKAIRVRNKRSRRRGAAA